METQKITIEMTDADRKEFVRLCKKLNWECLPYDEGEDENLPEVRFRFKEQGRLVDASVFKYLLFKLIDAVAGDEVKWVSDDDADKSEPEPSPTPQVRAHAKNLRRAEICLRPKIGQQLREWASKRHLPVSCAVDHIVCSTLKRNSGQQIAYSKLKAEHKTPSHVVRLFPATWQLINANIGGRTLSEFLRAIIETFFNFNHQPSPKE